MISINDTSDGPLPAWIQPVERTMRRHGWRGGFVVCFPEYRPEIVRVLAERLGLEWFDFRAWVMAPAGQRAGRLPLSVLDDFVQEAADGAGAVVHNAEALLATKASDERASWLAHFLAADWPAPVVIPLVLFADDVPDHRDRAISLDAAALPEQTLLTRLLSVR